MTIRAIMMDVDGVLINHPDPLGWSVHLERDLGISALDLQRHFFAVHWDDIVHGRAKIHERLAVILAKIAPHIQCEALIDYWFLNDAHVNQELIEELCTLRNQGLSVHLATVQDHERAKYIWNTLRFCEYFDDMHYAAALGYSKPDAAFFKEIEVRTGFSSAEIFFVDDKQANVEGARSVGWRAEQWTGHDRLRALLSLNG